MRKRRTRNHIIADLSANHVERHALLCGYTVERMAHDYGVDLLLYTYNDDGEIENDTVKIQLKATDNLTLLQDGQRIPFLVSHSDLDYWLEEFLPVILIVYDASQDVAYWVYLQAYFQHQSSFDLTLAGDTTTVYLSQENVVSGDTMRLFARYKVNVLSQRPERIHYDV